MKFDEYLLKSKTAVSVQGQERRGLAEARRLRSFPVSVAVSRFARSPAGGGAGRDRTDDLRLAKAALPQLSYSPVVEVRGWWA